MINRCEVCDSPCPHYANLCKTCAYIEEEDRLEEELEEDEEIEDERI